MQFDCSCPSVIARATINLEAVTWPLVNLNGLLLIIPRWSAEKPQLRSLRNDAAFDSIAKEQLHSFETSGVQVVVDMMRQVSAHFFFAAAQAWRPFSSNLPDVVGLQAMISGLLKYLGQIQVSGQLAEGSLTHCPKSKDEGLARELAPLFRQIKGQ